ncbi:Tfp pilus assembly protein FimT/FimU [Undibacterium arcticum]
MGDRRAVVPRFHTGTTDQKNASYDVSYTLTFARSEAIKRNNDVVLSPATGGWKKTVGPFLRRSVRSLPRSAITSLSLD